MITAAQTYLLNQWLANANIPGYDDQQGNPLPLSALLPLAVIPLTPGSGVYYNAANNTIVVTQNGAVLNGLNLSGVGVDVRANNVTISNCTFNDLSGQITVEQMSGYSGLTVQNCTFNGGDNCELSDFISSINGYVTIENNSFINTPSHTIGLTCGVVANNYFSGGGYQSGSHSDAINIYNTTGSVLVTGNYIDWTNNSGAAVGTNNAIRITNEGGACNNVTVTNNVFLGGEYSVAVTNQNSDPTATFSNVNISNNYIGDYVCGAYYPSDPPGVTLGSYTDVGFDNPVLSAQAWSAYQASDIVTDSLVQATATQTSINAAATGTTTLYGGGVSGAHLGGGSSETIFVGGSGIQYMTGGSGLNIFSYLAASDSTVQAPDYIGNFHVATDIIDLHSLNANPGASTPVAFTFIGSNAFSAAGGEVCVVQNAALNQTLVEADLVGDSSADLEIRIAGLVNLTAANFAFTAAQYAADTAPYTTVASFRTSQSSLDQIAGGYSIVDSAANIQPNIGALQADASNINAVTSTTGAASFSAAIVAADQASLNKFAGGFAVVDTGANIQAQISVLEQDVGSITAVTLSDSTAAAPDVLSLSAANAASDAAILAKINAPYVLDVTGASGTTVTGVGSGLTIDIAAGATGPQKVTGGAKGDTFYFSANFGAAEITDFAQYASNSKPDAIALSTTDFANWSTLLADGNTSGANTTFVAGDGASLTLDGITLKTLQHASPALQAEFQFHA